MTLSCRRALGQQLSSSAALVHQLSVNTCNAAVQSPAAPHRLAAVCGWLHLEHGQLAELGAGEGKVPGQAVGVPGQGLGGLQQLPPHLQPCHELLVRPEKREQSRRSCCNRVQSGVWGCGGYMTCPMGAQIGVAVPVWLKCGTMVWEPCYHQVDC